MITDYILEKKVFLTAFRQVLPKILPKTYIFSNTIMTNLKKLIGNKSLIQNSIQQDYLPQLSPKRLLETLGMGENTSQQQKFTNFALQKNPFHLITLYKLHLQL